MCSTSTAARSLTTTQAMQTKPSKSVMASALAGRRESFFSVVASGLTDTHNQKSHREIIWSDPVLLLFNLIHINPVHVLKKETGL